MAEKVERTVIREIERGIGVHVNGSSTYIAVFRPSNFSHNEDPTTVVRIVSESDMHPQRIPNRVTRWDREPSSDLVCPTKAKIMVSDRVIWSEGGARLDGERGY